MLEDAKVMKKIDGYPSLLLYATDRGSSTGTIVLELQITTDFMEKFTTPTRASKKKSPGRVSLKTH